jgi:voltage-gated potassium channel
VGPAGAVMRTSGIYRRFETRMGLRPKPGLAVARHEFFHFLRRLSALVGSVALLILAGAGALAAFEHVSYWQGTLWALDTVATIGSIPEPDALGGQITKVVLTIFGVGTMFFVLVTLTELFVAGDLSGLLEARRMQSQISQLKDHYLICGFGRVGSQIAADFLAAGVPFVVIDDNPTVRETADEMEVLLLEGRGSDDEVMIEAGIERARGLIACVDSDAENIFITLTARELRPDMQIVARAASEASERKLIRAGANEVVSPYKASGRTMASLALASRDGEEMPHTRESGAVVRGAKMQPSARAK